MQGGSPQNEEPEAESAEEPEEEKEESKEEPASEPEPETEPEEDLRTTRNDDTNEPAIQRERRSARMVRRRDR